MQCGGWDPDRGSTNADDLTLSGQRVCFTSALGQKQTCAVQNVMSALPPIADMCGATRDVRFVPKADMTDLSRNSMIDQNRNLAVRENLDGHTAEHNCG